MTIGRFAVTPAEARATFVALRDLGERLRARWPRLGPELSMGMSDDYEIAVEEGATIVRVGRALFGERPRGAGRRLGVPGCRRRFVARLRPWASSGSSSACSCSCCGCSCFGRVLLSWFDPTGSNQVSRFLIQATEPLLAPVRRVLPPAGMFDFSALLVLIVLGALWRAFL